MSDDFDALFDMPVSAPAAAPATAATSAVVAVEDLFESASAAASPAAPARPVAPASPPAEAAAPEREVWLQVFRPGTRVYYKDNPHTVSYVRISKGNLMVHFNEMEGAIPAEVLRLDPVHMTIHFSVPKVKPVLPPLARMPSKLPPMKARLRVSV